MRQYPRALYKDGSRIKVFTEQEEYDAGVLGYECHSNPEKAKEKEKAGKGVLRVNPMELIEQEKKEKENAQLAQIEKMQDSLIERAKEKIKKELQKKPGRKPKEVVNGTDS
jgi:hypothetical protein